MIVLCSPSSQENEVGLYHVQKVHSNFYQATLKKFTGNRNNFPGIFLLWRNPGDWHWHPEGYRSLVNCLVEELEKLV